MVQPSTKVTPWIYLGVVHKTQSAPLGPLTEAKEQALGDIEASKDPEPSAYLGVMYLIIFHTIIFYT